MNDPDIKIDTRGQRCPMPLLQAKKALRKMQVGQVLCVEATDPSAKGDFDAMLRHLPDVLIDYQRIESINDERYPWVDHFYIQKGALSE